MRYVVVFWAGGVTNVLLWMHSLGCLTPDTVLSTLIWPWYAVKYLGGF